jgi:hypothetical protein
VGPSSLVNVAESAETAVQANCRGSVGNHPDQISFEREVGEVNLTAGAPNDNRAHPPGASLQQGDPQQRIMP